MASSVTTQTDEDIQHQVRRELNWDAEVPSNDVGVIVQHAVQLSRQGHDVDLVLTRPAARPDWSHHGLAGARVVGLADARAYDVALSTWWETAGHLFALDAGRCACFPRQPLW